MEFTESDKKIILSILEKGQQLKEKLKDRTVIISFDEFYEQLNSEQIDICKKIMELNPRDLGFKGEFFGIKDVPQDIIAVKGQSYKYKGEIKSIHTQFLPKAAHEAVAKLQAALHSDLNKKLLIDSAYRSPAYQLFTFLFYLNFHQYDLNKTASRVALPGYSEHGDVQVAVDFITEDGIPADEDPSQFANTDEYKWLLDNANQFGFYLSYPEGNQLGVMFEPWHWRFKSSSI